MLISILLLFDCTPDLPRLIVTTIYCYYWKWQIHEENLRIHGRARTDAEKQLIEKDIEEARSELKDRKNRSKR